MAGPRAAGKAAGHTIRVQRHKRVLRKTAVSARRMGQTGLSPLEQAEQEPIFELSGNLWHICVPGNGEIGCN